MSNVMGYGNAPLNPLASSSGTHYGQQFPQSRVHKGGSLEPHSYATAPAALTVQKAPSYVVINNKGEYKFAYALTASIGTALVDDTQAHLFITGSILDADAGPVRLDISPSAWADASDGQAGKTGDVTFVYRGGE
tara:strand:- start:269 stop:673 length:405 start_codon:yes stop_codon:yes gene_type:complete